MHGQNGWKAAWAFVAFFGTLALIVPFATRRGWGLPGLFFAMVIAAALAYLVPLAFRLFRQLLSEQGIGMKDWGMFMMGAGYYQAETPQVVDSELRTDDAEQDKTPITGLVPYGQNGALGYDYGGDEGEENEWETAGFQTPAQARSGHLYRLNLGSHTLDLETAYEQILIFEMLTEGTDNVTVVLGEELANKRVPLLIVDFGGFHTLSPELPMGSLFGSLEGLSQLPVELQRRSIPIERRQAEALGQTMLHEGWQGILCFSSYASPVEASAILLLILQGMRKWQIQRTQLGEQPFPCIIMLNEAHRLLPYHDTYSIASDDPAMAQRLRTNLLAYLNARGKDGLYLYLVTRKVTAMNRAALGACGMWLVRQPPQSELRCLSESTGVHPEMFMQVRPDQVLLVDLLTRRFFPVTFRQSISTYEAQSVPLLLPPSLLVTTQPSSTATTGAPLTFATTAQVTRPAQQSRTEETASEGSSSGATNRYADQLLAYVCYLYAIDWLTTNAIRRVPDPLFDLARALGLHPVKGQDLMNRNRALTLIGYVKGLPKSDRARYLAMARRYAPAQPPRPRGGDRTLGHDPPARTTGWRLPSLAVLRPPDYTRAEQQVSEETLKELCRTVQETLEEQRVEAEVLRRDIHVGPRVIRIGIRPRRYPELTSDGKGGRRPRQDGDGNVLYKKTKVSQITALAKDLKLALAVTTMRMQAPVPGTDYVGIEVPNPVPCFVTFYEVLKSAVYQQAVREERLAIALGKDIAGRVRVGTITPHLLLAGQTGSGKSFGLNAIIGSVLMQATPDDVCLLMVDPKMVEFTKYQGIPHLLTPVITEVEQVKRWLERLILEMEQRYRLFAQAGVRNLEGYEAKRATTPELGRLPLIVVLIDELADLMMSGPKGEMDALICRLAQKARAAGIHLVLGTQRPTVDVVTGNIKANMPVRIAYKVATGTDARTIMDDGGAEQLLGAGDLLYLTPEAGGPERLQGALLSDPEIDAIVAHWKSEQERMQVSGAWTAGTYALPESAMQLSFAADAAAQRNDTSPTPRPTVSSDAKSATGGGDPLLIQVIAALANREVVSVDMLKRGTLSPEIGGMGHERACQIRDALLARGLIGPYSAASKGHPVLVKNNQDRDGPEEQEGA